MVVYVSSQSTESPSVRQSSSNAFSSSTVSRSQSATKFGRETATGSFGGAGGGSNDGSYGSDGSQRTPK